MKVMSNLKVLVAKFDQVDTDPELNFRETLYIENGMFQMVGYVGIPLKYDGEDPKEHRFIDIEIAQNWFKMRFGEEMSGHLLFAIKQTIKAHLLALS